MSTALQPSPATGIAREQKPQPARRIAPAPPEMEWWFAQGYYISAEARCDFMASFFQQRIGTSDHDSQPGHTLLVTVLDGTLGTNKTHTRINAAARDWMLQQLARADDIDAEWREVIVDEIRRHGPPRSICVAQDSAIVAGAGESFQLRWQDFTFESDTGVWQLCFIEPGSGRHLTLRFEPSTAPLRVACAELDEGMEYTSHPRVALRGDVDGVPVSGEASLEHQWGGLGWMVSKQSGRPEALGWDWFGLSLDDGSDWIIMRHWVAQTGELVGQRATMRTAGGIRHVSDKVCLTPRRHAEAGFSGIRHPVAWRIEIPELGADLEFDPLIDNQEVPLFSPVRGVWEGAGRVRGTVEGRPAEGRARGEFYGYGLIFQPKKLVERMAARVDRRLEEFLPRALDAATLRGLVGEPVWAHDPTASTESLCTPVWDLLDRKGKRWRPLFGALLLEALGVALEPYETLLSVTAELMHAGSLIVDDIEDSSQLRRGYPCIHLRYGPNVAINAANTLYFLPFVHLLEHPVLGESKRHRICEILLRNALRAHFGQGQDIFWSNNLNPQSLHLWLEDKLPEKILQMYHYKTGAAVEGLAEVACIVADANAGVTEACADFGRSFSVAFQIMDDIHNFSDSAEWTKRCAEDIAEGKLTYVVVNALRMLEKMDRARLMRILCSKTLRQETEVQGEACELLRRSGALESCRREAQLLAERSWEKFAHALPNSWPRMILRLMTLRLLRQDFGCRR